MKDKKSMTQKDRETITKNDIKIEGEEVIKAARQ